MPGKNAKGHENLSGNATKRILYLLEYLYAQTDEEHPTTVTELISCLGQHGMEVARKTIYADIETLTALGVDIITRRSTQNLYFVGNRLFQLPELKMLIDAVESSKIISREKSDALIRKLCKLTSVAHGARTLVHCRERSFSSYISPSPPMRRNGAAGHLRQCTSP